MWCVTGPSNRAVSTFIRTLLSHFWGGGCDVYNLILTWSQFLLGVTTLIHRRTVKSRKSRGMEGRGMARRIKPPDLPLRIITYISMLLPLSRTPWRFCKYYCPCSLKLFLKPNLGRFTFGLRFFFLEILDPPPYFWTKITATGQIDWSESTSNLSVPSWNLVQL